MAFTYGFPADHTLGVNFSKKTTVKEWTPGTLCKDNKGRTWVYVKANGTIAKGKMVKATANDDPFTNVVVATASAAATMILGITVQDLAAGDYAWIVKSGVVEDDAGLGTVSAGEPFVSDASGTAATAAAADINNAVGVVLVDDGATGSVLLY